MSRLCQSIGTNTSSLHALSCKVTNCIQTKTMTTNDYIAHPMTCMVESPVQDQDADELVSQPDGETVHVSNGGSYRNNIKQSP